MLEGVPSAKGGGQLTLEGAPICGHPVQAANKVGGSTLIKGGAHLCWRGCLLKKDVVNLRWRGRPPVGHPATLAGGGIFRGVARGGQRGHLPPLFSRKTRVLSISK